MLVIEESNESNSATSEHDIWSRNDLKNIAEEKFISENEVYQQLLLNKNHLENKYNYYPSLSQTDTLGFNLMGEETKKFNRQRSDESNTRRNDESDSHQNKFNSHPNNSNNNNNINTDKYAKIFENNDHNFKGLDRKRMQKFKRHSRNNIHDNGEPHHELYIELEELHHRNSYVKSTSTFDEASSYEWKIANRWIKYEQSIDPETNIWSKPYVGALVYQNLIYLKNTLQYGTIILNAQETTIEDVVEEVMQDFISRGHMNRDHKDNLKAIILSQHRSQITIARSLTGKKASITELFSSFSKHKFNSNHSIVIDNNTGGNLYRKNSLLNAFYGNKNGHSRPDELSSLNDLNDEQRKIAPVKFFVPSTTIDSSTENNLNHTHAHQHKHIRSTLNVLKNSFSYHSKISASELSLVSEIESCLIMVGVVDFLDRPVMAFVRLQNDMFIEHLVEFQMRVRFLFIFIGPNKNNINYHEIGRCMGTLMINKDFNRIAYKATTRQDITRAITSFSNKSLCLVLPIGDFDEDLLQPIIEWIRSQMKKKQKFSYKLKKDVKLPLTAQNTKNESETTGKDHDNHEEDKLDPFKRTGWIFGSLFKEAKHRYAQYFTDIRDGLNLHCLIAFIFIFTVCVAPALSFGGILADKTNQWFGLNEMLIATSLNGLFFAIFSGQPLMIFGATGPFLVFEEMLYIVAFWVLLFSLLMVAFECVFVIHFVTRFTEEIFAFLIACVFLTDAIKKIIMYFVYDPIYKSEKYCEIRINNETFQYNLNSSYYQFNNKTKSKYYSYKCVKYNTNYLDDELIQYNKSHHNPEPNIALISVILLVGTCCMAIFFKKLRRSTFFGSYIRRTLSDVGILISIILMVVVDYLIRQNTHINTQKLDIPDSITPTKSIRHSWFVSPLGNNYADGQNFPLWVPISAALPALVIFIVLFFEVELTGIILTNKSRKLQKGTGFNLDLVLGALMMVVNSLFGLPWLCAAPVRTLAHWASLTVYSNSVIPGEKQKLIQVREQRVTAILVHLAIGLCFKAKFVLKLIPVSVLFGIFLYFGIVSLSGTQLYERIKLIFKPFKYCPNLPYATGVRPYKRNLFTILQIIGVIVLLFLKSFATISFIFPIILVLLVPFRKFLLPKIFTHRELEQLDDENEIAEDADIAHDFYELTHLPI